ncbi:hypothetical protein [Streptacidiphilus fuscans]|uniref:Uncharacterized protein n=1 Tax=Streptacidiphilus fuscans TaxID=2789292 RepID=A0A931FHB3_9ACTN|nr:hypothetical protein [Streptacidiphilus fuscans]MBF9071661.1 hypothetical protein [Streptacidiphilus fuscans]MBF9072852.1 hypothetical protein [Streptacidiphilus fuscans]
MRRSMVLSAIAVVAVGAVVGLWWKPWQSTIVKLPQSACWGILDQSDIRPVVGISGEVTAVTTGPLVPPPLKYANRQTLGPDECDIRWNGAVVAEADVSGASSDALSVAASGDTLLPLAPGVVMTPYAVVPKIYFRCTGIQGGWTYGVVSAQSMNGGVDPNGSMSAAALNGFANIALKLAKVAAAEIPCTNHLDFPSAVPTLKPQAHYRFPMKVSSPISD